jgi:hypothetical protein
MLAGALMASAFMLRAPVAGVVWVDSTRLGLVDANGDEPCSAHAVIAIMAERDTADRINLIRNPPEK